MQQLDNISQEDQDGDILPDVPLGVDSKIATNHDTGKSDHNTLEGGLAKPVTDLEFMLKEKDIEIDKLTKLSAKYERLLEKANKYNEDLRHELDVLSSQMHIYRTVGKGEMKSVYIQVTELEIEEGFGNKPMPVWITNGDQSAGDLSIAECLKAAAEAELQNQLQDATTFSSSESGEIKPEVASEYVFDESSGLYYHSATGYYWDPNSGLFYDYTTGTYFKYNETTGEYAVHSQAEVSGQTQIPDSENNKLCTEKSSIPHNVDSISSRFAQMKIDLQRCRINALEMAEEYPPCIRVIVQSSEHLKCGSLYIITCTGGSVGREKNKGLAIQIDDLNVSKLHAEITFDYEEHCYTLRDKGSSNGTVLNGVKLSQTKPESNCCKLQHDDLLQIGNTTFLLHIHKGSETCDSCEPGQVQARIKAANVVKNVYPVMSQEEKKRQRMRELKNIKKKYGLQNSYYEHLGSVYTNPDYTDKAYLRRKVVGSESEQSKHNAEPVSVHSPISAQNKGHKLLAKMGWKEGEGLGKTSSGIAEPITVEMRINQNAGLGANTNVALSLDNMQHAQKAKRWSQARRRYEQLKDNSHTSVSRHPLTVSNSTELSRSQSLPIPSTGLNIASASSCSTDSPSLPSPAFTSESVTISGVQTDVLKDSQHVIQASAMQSQKGKPKITWVKGDTEQIGQCELPKSPSPSETENT